MLAVKSLVFSVVLVASDFNVNQPNGLSAS
jgi:hypothetical protein